MHKAVKAVIIIVVVIVGFIVAIAIWGASNPGIIYEKKPDQITGVTQFIVMKDGSLYKARFSLTDANEAVATSDANVTFTVKSGGGFSPSSSSSPQANDPVLYQKAWNIKAEDFGQYQLVLTGAPIIAYSWQMDSVEITKNNTGSKTAVLNVTPVGGNRTFTAETTFF